MAACSSPLAPASSSLPSYRRRRTARRSLSSEFLVEHPPRTPEPSSPGPWKSLGTERSELSLALTLPTGQSFRWRQTGDAEYTGVVGRFLFTLRERSKCIEYLVHNHEGETVPRENRAGYLLRDQAEKPMVEVKEEEAGDLSEGPARENCTESVVDDEDEKVKVKVKDEERLDMPRRNHIESTISNEDKGKAEDVLRDYFNLDISLKDVWVPFIAADQRFAALAPHLAGARLLRQNPVECLFQFICSSNNHIQRITHMVDYLASQGPYLGTVNGAAFHAFPSLDVLAELNEAQLRTAGFGYRAKYIIGAVKELQSKEGGGEAWLCSLRYRSLDIALEELCSLPGVGPKVAACVALFSLDQHHAIPVDTHVWRIATTYIMPELAGARLTAKLHVAVSEAFVKKFGKYAGWAQNVLFIAELLSHQVHLPEHLRTCREKKSKAKNNKKIKIAKG